MDNIRQQFNDTLAEERLVAYGSEETLSVLDDIGPLKERIPQWAGQPVFIFMPHDLQIVSESYGGDFHSFVRDHSGQENPNISSSPQPDLLKKIKSYLEQNASAAAPVGRNGEFSNFCLIVMEGLNHNARQDISDFTKIPLDLLGNNFGTDEEWYVATIQHESVHCRQVSSINFLGDARNILPRELEAEQGFININENEKDDPVLKETAYIPYYQRLARAVGTLDALFYTHAMSANIKLPDENNIPEFSDHTHLVIHNAVNSFRQVFAENYASDSAWAEAFEKYFKIELQRKSGGIPENEKRILFEEYDLTSAQVAIETGHFEDFKKSLQRLPEFYAKISHRTGYLQTAEADKTLELYDKYYRALETLQDSGIVSDPAGQRLLMLAKTGLTTFIPNLRSQDTEHQPTIIRDTFTPSLNKMPLSN